METFADYILNEKNLGSKMEIVYYLSKKEKIFFDKSVIFKTEIARLFANNENLQLDSNLILTAALLSSCKKAHVATDLEKIRAFAKEGAQYLSEIGFDKRFCKICEGMNRYSLQKEREPESDIIELVDQFGAMLLDRPERVGMSVEEALVLLQHRNLKDVNNIYVHKFAKFINKLEQVKISKENDITPLKFLVNKYKEIEDVKKFIIAMIYEYEPTVDEEISKVQGDLFFVVRSNQHKLEKGDPNRPLFSEETTRKIIGKLG